MNSDNIIGMGFVAALIATAGLWWFRLLMKNNLAQRSATLRNGVYIGIWLAYFAVIMLLAQSSGQS